MENEDWKLLERWILWKIQKLGLEKYKQVQLAKDANIKPQYITQIKNGTKIDRIVGKKFAIAFGVSEGKFYDGPESLNKKNDLQKKLYPFRRNNDNERLRGKIMGMICVICGKNLENLAEITRKIYLDSYTVKKAMEK